MKSVNATEMRQVNGGRWKCNKCGAKYKIWLALYVGDHVGKCGLDFGYKWCW